MMLYMHADIYCQVLKSSGTLTGAAQQLRRSPSHPGTLGPPWNGKTYDHHHQYLRHPQHQMQDTAGPPQEETEAQDTKSVWLVCSASASIQNSAVAL